LLLTRKTVLALAAACAVAFAVACAEPVEETLAHQLLPACFQREQSLERTFRTDTEWQSMANIHRGPLPPVDFGTTMVAAHLDGGGSACVRFSVDSVQVTSSRVLVNAARHTSPDPCIALLAYPQLVLSFAQQDLPVSFRIRDVRDNGGDTARCP
jgi:hypothetical protein